MRNSSVKHNVSTDSPSVLLMTIRRSDLKGSLPWDQSWENRWHPAVYWFSTSVTNSSWTPPAWFSLQDKTNTRNNVWLLSDPGLRLNQRATSWVILTTLCSSRMIFSTFNSACSKAQNLTLSPVSVLKVLPRFSWLVFSPCFVLIWFTHQFKLHSYK